MSQTLRTTPGDLLDIVAAALDDLNAGSLDRALPLLEWAETDRERELLARLRETVVGRRRAALRLQHLASALAAEVTSVRGRVAVTAAANAGVTNSAEACLASASELSDSARRITTQAHELHRLSESAAEATAEVAESGQTGGGGELNGDGGGRSGTIELHVRHVVAVEPAPQPVTSQVMRFLLRSSR